MNEQLQAKLLEYLNNGEAFMKEQVPEYVQQALSYYAWQAGFEFKFFVSVLILAFVMAITSYRLQKDSDNEGFGLIVGFISLFCFLAGMVGVPCSYSELKKIQMAPKVFLVDKLIKK